MQWTGPIFLRHVSYLSLILVAEATSAILSLLKSKNVSIKSPSMKPYFKKGAKCNHIFSTLKFQFVKKKIQYTSMASVFRSFMKLLQKSWSIRPTNLITRQRFRWRSDKNAKKSGGKDVTMPENNTEIIVSNSNYKSKKCQKFTEENSWFLLQ